MRLGTIVVAHNWLICMRHDAEDDETRLLEPSIELKKPRDSIEAPAYFPLRWIGMRKHV